MTLDLAKLRAETLALIDGTTQGPWMRVGWQPCGIYTAGDVSTAIRIATMDRRHEHDANARLIAAAPSLAADTLRLVDEIERLRDVLERIAIQKRTDELVTALDVEYADFEDGYDIMIDEARAALAEGGPDDR